VQENKESQVSVLSSPTPTLGSRCPESVQRLSLPTPSEALPGMRGSGADVRAISRCTWITSDTDCRISPCWRSSCRRHSGNASTKNTTAYHFWIASNGWTRKSPKPNACFRYQLSTSTGQCGAYHFRILYQLRQRFVLRKSFGRLSRLCLWAITIADGAR